MAGQQANPSPASPTAIEANMDNTDIENNSQENKCQERLSTIVNFFWARVSTSVGLFLVLIAYTFFGAGIMYGIEGYYTYEKKLERVNQGYIPMEHFLEDFVNKTMNNTNVSSVIDHDQLQSVLEQYESARAQNEELHELRDHSYWEWMLFCLTVYTTIGK